MAPETVRIVLVEGEGAGGVRVDQADFQVPGAAAADQVIEAILGTRESAAESGYQVRSSGVTWTDQTDATALRNALAAHKIENVMLVSAFTAAAALAQAVGSATNCARTALLFVEPATATLAVVDTSDGSIADVHRKPLPNSDDAVLAELAAMLASAESMHARPDSVFLVGSGVDIPLMKPALEAATSLSVTAPEEPEMGPGAGCRAGIGERALWSAEHGRDAVRPGSGRELAYSAEADNEPDAAPGDYREYAARDGRRSRKALAILGATAIFVVGAVALTLALALGIRPHVDQRPDISKNVVAPATQAAPPPPQAPMPASLPPAAPEPAAPTPGPSLSPPQWLPPLPPRDDDHDDHWGWLRRHLGHGILGP
jgi:hypothetical protein